VLFRFAGLGEFLRHELGVDQLGALADAVAAEVNGPVSSALTTCSRTSRPPSAASPNCWDLRALMRDGPVPFRDETVVMLMSRSGISGVF
jgi:hypothetical protein